MNSKEMNECEVNNIENMNASAKEWWKEYNMVPVRWATFKLALGGYYLYALVMIISIWILYCLSVVICMLFLEGFPKLFNYEAIQYEYWHIAICVLISIIFGLSMLFLWFKYVISIYYAPNWIRKKRKELLDDDFIENYESRKKHYVFIARGTSESHCFGLFDVQKIKITVPLIYDKLEWREQGGEFLTATKDGKSVIIDVNGNVYK